MKKALISLCILMTNTCCYSQIRDSNINISVLDGIWHNVTDTTQYFMFKGGNSIGLIYNKYGNIYAEKNFNPYYFIGRDKYGFVSKGDSLYKNIKLIGNPKKDLFYWSGSTGEVELEDSDKIERIELVNENVFDYIKIEKLPNAYVKGFYQQGKKDKQDYLKEFLEMNMREIIVPKSTIYSISQIPTQRYLVKGDEVEILESKDEWLKIRYYGKKIIDGWIKKSDVEM